MKTKILTLTLALVLALGMLLSCGETVDLWNDATYKENTTLGEGEKSFSLVVSYKENSITITVKTNEKNLGDALYSLNIINDPAFFDTVNGIKADWNADKAYWALLIGGEFASVGASEVEIKGGENFKLVYTK